ncbi:MAG: hypothetical protein JXA66_02475 [Oligoflexia bacterium]|nr:hypothetical protein [Oligoflexia bacterium]
MTHRHSFLFEEGTWNAKGSYYDSEDNVLKTEGQTTITHTGNLWVNEGYMRLLKTDPAEFSSRYEFTPAKPNETMLDSVSVNPVTGKISGTLTVVDNSLISSRNSENNDYSGCKFLIKTDAEKYLNYGYLKKGNTLVSRWSLELEKE